MSYCFISSMSFKLLPWPFAPKSDGYTFFSVSQERIMDELDQEAKRLQGPKTGANWDRCWDCARPALNQNRWCRSFVFSAWTGLCSVSEGNDKVVFVDFKMWRVLIFEWKGLNRWPQQGFWSSTEGSDRLSADVSTSGHVIYVAAWIFIKQTWPTGTIFKSKLFVNDKGAKVFTIAFICLKCNIWSSNRILNKNIK